MKSIFASSLVTLGLLVAGATAQEVQWRTAAPRPADNHPTPSTASAVQVLRPVPLTDATPGGVAIQPVSFNTAGQSLIARGKALDAPLPLPLPTGPLSGDDIQGMGGGVKTPPAEIVPFPPTTLAPITVQPVPMHSGDNWGTNLSPHQVIGPDGVLVGDDCCSDGCGILSGVGNFFGKFSNGCCPTGTCCQLPRFWGSAEFLLWTMRSQNTPPLVAIAPGGAVAGNPGINPDLVTGMPVAGGRLDQGTFPGGRFSAGFTLACMPNLGFEATYFFLGRRTSDLTVGSNGLPGSVNVGRPVQLADGTESAEKVAMTGQQFGTVRVTNTSDLWGGELNLRRRLLCGCNGYLDVLGGFRYLDLQEGIVIREDLTLLAPIGAAPAGTRELIIDEFTTRNQFYGGQLGLAGEYRFWKKFYMGGTVKVALGVMHQELDVRGNTTFIVPGIGTATGTGGLLAEPTNIRHVSRDRFGVVPEVGMKLGYNVTDHIRVFVGYNFLYANSVVRPGDQIDRVVNISQQPMFLGGNPPTAPNGNLVGAARPRPLFQTSDFWAQGVSMGVEFRY